jgi:uncharacterized tellurite resistance protein B-like protein|tara:strand:- start:1230 stop:1649 length:420 start_codon:yes stop_codon:yes gene_type:complete
MLNFFKTEKASKENNISVISVACLLIHAARIDENYSNKEKEIIKKTLFKLGTNDNNIDDIIEKAEDAEKNSNQILKFTKEAKNLEIEKKIILLDALWSIIYSDKSADIYETNLMRRISGLLYLDNKMVGDIKEKIRNNK